MSQQEEKEAGTTRRDEREALMMRLGGLAFAVYADECECVERLSKPTPLPHAPAPVLGVVLVRGRMRTVIHPARLFEVLGLEIEQDDQELGFTASLVGDEQLALVFGTGRSITLTPEELTPPPESPALPVHATFARHGETIYLLDPARLFDAALSGTERRRQRAVNGEP